VCYDRRRRIAQGRSEGVDIGARQRRGRDRNVMISDPERLGEAPRLGSGQLPRVFAIRTVVNNCAGPRLGQRLYIRAIEPAGNAQSGRQGNKLRRQAAPSPLPAERSFAARRYQQNQAANWGGRCTRSPARIQNRSSRRRVTPTAWRSSIFIVACDNISSWR
jgi:hypothetical protein